MFPGKSYRHHHGRGQQGRSVRRGVVEVGPLLGLHWDGHAGTGRGRRVGLPPESGASVHQRRNQLGVEAQGGLLPGNVSAQPESCYVQQPTGGRLGLR